MGGVENNGEYLWTLDRSNFFAEVTRQNIELSSSDWDCTRNLKVREHIVVCAEQDTFEYGLKVG